ncbi:MAG: hypothetical protein ABSB12_00025 [Candidatus Saccharimonadales bacterium]|jgi:hypothetical protein
MKSSSESDFRQADLSLPEAREVTWDAANMALANAYPGSEVLNGLLSERIGFLFNEIDLAALDAEVTAEAKPHSKNDDYKINLGSLLLKTEALAKSIHGEPEIPEGTNPFHIEDEGYLATQALKFYLEAAYNEFKTRKYSPKFKSF